MEQSPEEELQKSIEDLVMSVLKKATFLSRWTNFTTYTTPFARTIMKMSSTFVGRKIEEALTKSSKSE